VKDVEKTANAQSKSQRSLRFTLRSLRY